MGFTHNNTENGRKGVRENPAKSGNKNRDNYYCPKCNRSNSTSHWLRLNTQQLPFSCLNGGKLSTQQGDIKPALLWTNKKKNNNGPSDGLDAADSESLMRQRPAIFSSAINTHVANRAAMAASGWRRASSMVMRFLLNVRARQMFRPQTRGPSGKQQRAAASRTGILCRAEKHSILADSTNALLEKNLWAFAQGNRGTPNSHFKSLAFLMNWRGTAFDQRGAPRWAHRAC